MRWWLNTDHKAFSVDNAFVRDGMDFSSLEPDIWMIQWIDGRGEIERQDPTGINPNGTPGLNLNGLREAFYDITPYCPLFQQFLTLMQAKALLLPQAQKVQIELIDELFDSKRQLPFHYPVAAGDYWWDASDSTMGTSTNAALQNTITKLNEVIARLNALVDSSINSTLVGEINADFSHANSNDASIVNQTNSDATAPGNALVADINNTVVTQVNNIVVAEVNANIVGPINSQIVTPLNANVASENSLITYINNTVLGTRYVGSTNTINDLLQAPPSGLAGDIAHTGISFGSFTTIAGIAGIAGVTTSFGTLSVPPAIPAIAPLPWTDIANVASSNQQWIPIGGTSPVNVTPAEQAAIMAGIAARTNSLNLTRNAKITAVNALTTIAAVIAYDVTAGW